MPMPITAIKFKIQTNCTNKVSKVVVTLSVRSAKRLGTITLRIIQISKTNNIGTVPFCGRPLCTCTRVGKQIFVSKIIIRNAFAIDRLHPVRLRENCIRVAHELHFVSKERTEIFDMIRLHAHETNLQIIYQKQF